MWWYRFILVFSLLFLFNFLGFCSSQSQQKVPKYTFMHNASSAPTTSYYDYIIVGGGTAGCPLAATLSQNYTVLLLERGGSPYGNPNITDRLSFGAPIADHSPSSPSQRFVSEDGVINARARVLGGGTCLNAGFYSRASAFFVGNAGWEAALVNHSYRWVEDKVAFRPHVRRWQTALRDGLLEVGVVPNNGFTYDHVYGTKVGGTIFDENGHRHTAADLLEYANSRGITVLLYAVVHKILFLKGKGIPVAHGVMFRDENGEKRRAYVKTGSKSKSKSRGEVIIAAGAIGSPQLLMLSGVGPLDELRAHNITVVLEQAMVGQGVSDNPMNAIYVPSPVPVEVSLIEVVGITHFGSFIEGASGETYSNFLTTRDFGMFSPKIGQLSTLPPKQRTPEAIAKAIEVMDGLQQQAFQGGFILEKIDGPQSTGHINLTTTNPNANPSVTFNYFKEPEDLRRCVEGLHTIEKIIDSRAFSRFKYDDVSIRSLLNMTINFPVNLLPKHTNDTRSLPQFCRDTVMTIWHYHGGCQVGRVVDRDYKVNGVDSLRVVDGSTFRFSPGTNPQATVMMLGRYMGVRILRERLESEQSN